MANQKRTRFQILEDRIRVDEFLALDQRQDSEFARIIVESVYGVMRLLEWPDEMWSIATMLNGQLRPFFHERSDDIGVILLLQIVEARARVPFTVRNIDIEPTYRFTLGKTKLGDFDPANKDSFASLAKAFEDAVVEVVQDGRYKAT